MFSVTYNKMIAFWDNVYGFKMSCMRKDVVKEASTDIIKKECIITSSGKYVCERNFSRGHYFIFCLFHPMYYYFFFYKVIEFLLPVL